MTSFLRMAFLMVLLAACQPSDTVLPTVASISEIRTGDASTPSAIPSPVSTQRSLVLPPTFTPTVLPTTEPATPQPTRPATDPTPAPASGTLYYLRDQQMVMAQPLDGSAARVVRDFGFGAAVTDMMLSPDEQLLAVVAPAADAYEVYVLSLDGSYLQQVSCLGLSVVRLPAWTPDSTTLTWYAASSPDDPGNIYRATLAGSGRCPADNQQAVLVRMPSATFAGMVWNLSGDTLLYTRDDNLNEFDPITQATTVLAYGSGYGPNQRPRLSVLGEAGFLAGVVSATGKLMTSASVNTDVLFPGQRQTLATNLPASLTDVRWSPDGSFLLGVGTDQLALWQRTNGNVRPLIADLSDPLAVFVGNTRLAYTVADRRGVQQWGLLDIASGQTTVFSRNEGGSISDPFWVP